MMSVMDDGVLSAGNNAYGSFNDLIMIKMLVMKIYDIASVLKCPADHIKALCKDVPLSGMDSSLVWGAGWGTRREGLN